MQQSVNSVIEVKLRKSLLKFDNNNAVFKEITVRINSITQKFYLVIGVKIETPSDNLRRQQNVAWDFQGYFTFGHNFQNVT